MKQSLYELTENLKSLYEIHESAWDIFDNKEANQAEGIALVGELSEALKIGEKEFDEKMEGYAKFIKVLEHRVGLKSDEINRLSQEVHKLKKSIHRDEALISLLSFRMKEALKTTGKKSVDTGLFRISTRKTSSVEANNFQKLLDSIVDAKYELNERKVHMLDLDKSILNIPENIMDIIKNNTRVKITLEPDKTAIKEAIKNGQIIPGASIVVNESIQIK